jgi:hypothetical protein
MCSGCLSRIVLGMHPLILSTVTNQLAENRVDSGRRARASRRRLLRRGGRAAPRFSGHSGRLRTSGAGR